MSAAQIAQLRAMLAARPPPSPDISARRAGFEALARRFTLPPDAALEASGTGAPGLWVRPAGADPSRVILYLHGGAFTVGSARSHAELAGRIAAASGAHAFSVEYRLAPEHHFPAQIDDCFAAYEGLRAQGFAGAKIAVCGDSAGGNLAVALVIRLIESGVEQPAALGLISPYLDLTHSGASIRERAHRDPFIDTAGMERTAATYLGDHRPDDPAASPAFANLAGLPPTFVQVGEDEVLYDDAAHFAARAKACGVTCVLDAWPDMVHVFPFFAQMLDEGAEAAARIGRFLGQHLA
jgi:acetyl esterase/lipase